MMWMRARKVVTRFRLSVVLPDLTGGPEVPKAKPHIFKLQADELLPIIDLSHTVVWSLLSSSRHSATFFKWIKRRYCILTAANRCGLLLGLLTLLLPDEGPRYWLVALACTLTLPATCCSSIMLSLDMLQILAAQYEFWFFTCANAVTWATLGVLCNDERLVLLVIAWWEIELLIMIDSNFRTFVPAVTSAALAIPTLLGLLIAVYLRRLSIPPAHYAFFFEVGELKIEAIEIFLNAILTLFVFLVRLVYNKRKLIFQRRSRWHTRVVRCEIVYCPLVLRPLASHVIEKGNTDRKFTYGTRIMLKQLGITAPKLVPSLKAGRVTSTRQQLSLVSLRLSTIDTLRTLKTSCLPLRASQVIALYGTGSLGLLLAGGSMLIPESTQPVRFALLPFIPFASFLCTLLFCVRVACVYQRDIVRAMLINFNFLFPSLQFTLACICLADAMRWDVRCWAVAAYGLWFHWILLLDALTPPGRSQLRFRKHFAVPVVVAVWIGLCSVLYAIIINSPTLYDRVVVHWHMKAGLPDITTDIKTILLNRIVTILLWTLRIMWRIWTASDAELVLTKGTLEYYCPFDIVHSSSTRKTLGPRKPVLPPSVDTSLQRYNSLVLGRREETKRKPSVGPLLKAGTDGCLDSIRRPSCVSTMQLTRKLSFVKLSCIPPQQGPFTWLGDPTVLQDLRESTTLDRQRAVDADNQDADIVQGFHCG